MTINTHKKALLSLAAILLLAGLPSLAQDEGDKERSELREVEVEDGRRVVISVTHSTDGDGEQFVWFQRDGEEPILRAIPMGKPRGYLGVNLTEMTPELRQAFGVPDDVGVLVNRVVPETPAARAGLQAGDVITRIEGADIASSAAVQAEVFPREAGDVVALEIYRGRTMQQLSVTLDQVERPRLNLAEFAPQLYGGSDIRTELRFVAPHVETLPLERLENLERLELKTLPFDEDRLKAILESSRANRLITESLTEEERQEYEKMRQKLEERLKELEKRIQELEERKK